MKTTIALVALVVAVMMLAGCAPGPNRMVGTADAEGEVAGFWLGLWNGFISPVTFIVSLFSANVKMYDVHNSGNWYDLGFILGVMIIFGGGGGGTCSKRRKR